MDMTAIGVMFFALLKIAIWLGLLALGFYYGRQIWAQMNPDTLESEEPVHDVDQLAVLRQNRYKIGGWTMAFFAAVFFTQIEAAYRPKTVIQSDNLVLEQQLREVDRATAPVIKPAQGDLRDASNANYSAENAADNAAARERFLTLPDDKE